MGNYIFDKRKVKKTLKKYGAIFSVLIVLMFLISFAMDRSGASETATLVFLVVFGLFFVAGVEWALYMRRQNKEEQGKESKQKDKKVVVINAKSEPVKTKQTTKNEKAESKKPESEVASEKAESETTTGEKTEK